jgi:hypothetical protein
MAFRAEALGAESPFGFPRTAGPLAGRAAGPGRCGSAGLMRSPSSSSVGLRPPQLHSAIPDRALA